MIKVSDSLIKLAAYYGAPYPDYEKVKNLNTDEFMDLIDVLEGMSPTTTLERFDAFRKGDPYAWDYNWDASRYLWDLDYIPNHYSKPPSIKSQINKFKQKYDSVPDSYWIELDKLQKQLDLEGITSDEQELINQQTVKAKKKTKIQEMSTPEFVNYLANLEKTTKIKTLKRFDAFRKGDLNALSADWKASKLSKNKF
jgi:hypothetical protein